jgi:hypothetical protein
VPVDEAASGCILLVSVLLTHPDTGAILPVGKYGPAWQARPLKVQNMALEEDLSGLLHATSPAAFGVCTTMGLALSKVIGRGLETAARKLVPAFTHQKSNERRHGARSDQPDCKSYRRQLGHHISSSISIFRPGVANSEIRFLVLRNRARFVVEVIGCCSRQKSTR